MTIQLIDPKLIDPNPFQPPTRLQFTADNLADLASLGDPAIGLRQIPVCRPHPTRPGRYQRCDGHRRMAAWLLYRPGEPMPNDVQDLTDRQMYDFMAVENGQRQDLTPIERAVIIKGHIERFGTTQLAAGALVGLRTQGAVSNLLRLLNLPAGVQSLVNPDQVPQRIARQLIAPSSLAPKEITALAQHIAAAEDDEKESIAENGLRDVLNRKAQTFGWRAFKTHWQPGPLTIAGATETPPACDHCPLYQQVGNAQYCLRRVCYAAKKSAWPQAELERISKKFGIPIAGPDEKAKKIQYDYRNESRVKGWLSAKTRPDHLRLIGLPESNPYVAISNVLGSDCVVLASIDPNPLDKPKADEPKPDRSTETPAQRARRIAREQQEQAERRAERAAARRARADVTWLMQQLTLDTAMQLKIEGGVLAIAAHDISLTTGVLTDWTELAPFERMLHGSKEDKLRKQLIVFKLLLVGIQTYTPALTFAWSRALKQAREVVEKTLELKLLPGWDQPPIHHTDANCHVCGLFTPGPSITGIDRAAGWQTAKDGTVTCSDDCRKQLPALVNRPSAAPTKAKAKPAPKKAKRQ